MLQVSRQFFETAAPVVWEKVVGVHFLMHLLPGFTATRSQAHTHSRRDNYITMKLSSLESTEFDRFDHYARFVKYLEIYPPHRHIFGEYLIEGWSQLLEQARHKFFLPNLLRLTLSGREISTHDQCLWIRTFISPSLDTIQVKAERSSPPNINSLAASVLLRYIVSNCPKLRTLSLFPKQTVAGTSTYRNSDDYTVLGLWESPGSVYENLINLSLRELACTFDILAPNTIHVLNRLPLLECLEVHCNPYGAPITPPTKITVKANDLDSQADEDAWATSLMTLISLCSPALTDLDIEFDPEMYFDLTSPSVIRPLAILPLQNVRLKLALVDDPVLEELHTIWPFATRIELSGLEDALGAHALSHFAKLPNLQHLLVDLEIDCLGSAVDPEGFAIAPNFRALQCTNSVDISVDLSLLAQYLLSFWPNLQHFILTEPGKDRTMTAKDRVLANALNTIISMHRAMNNSD